MAIKMIVTDLDGTLLRDDKTISERNLTALRNCREKGIKVVYATARGKSASIIAPVQHFDGRITNNGTLGYIDEDIVYNKLIPWRVAQPFLIACDARKLKMSASLDGMYYTNFDLTLDEPELTGFEMIDFREFMLDAEKVFTVAQEGEIIDFMQEQLPDELYLTVSRDHFVMVMHKDATKAKAVAELARIWGIEPAEIVAFGDDLNDIDLLKSAGISVAMGNAVERVKQIVDYISESNEEDGVAAWIEQHICAR